MNAHLKLDVGYQTHPGRVRQRNEDSLGLPPPNLSPDILAAKGSLYVVADGMGGYQGGQKASQMAVQSIMQEYYQDTSPDPQHSLARAIRMANAQIYQEAQRAPELQKMGTTVTAAVVRGHELLVANVGDSRTYLIRGEVARQLTEDHSLVAQGLKQGTITPAQADRHPYRGVITRALGGEPDIQTDFFREQLQPGDVVLLCSDGVSNEVDDRQIAAIIGRSRTAQEAAGRLVDQANQHGGRDNATAIVVSLDGRHPAGMAGLPPWLLPLAGGLLAVALVLAVLLAFPGRGTPEATPGTTPLATPQTYVAQGGTTGTSPLATPQATGTEEATTVVPATSGTPSASTPPTAPAVGTPTEAWASPSATPSPTASRTPTPTPSPTVTASPTPSSTPTPYPAPTLLAPEPGASLGGKTRFTFTWQYNGSPLGEGYAFDLRIWSKQYEGEISREQRRGAIGPTQETEVEVDLADVPAIRDYKDGVYYWAVVVVRVPGCYPGCPVEIVGEWSEVREFTYSAPREPTPTPKHLF